jgi:hypothetical protein
LKRPSRAGGLTDAANVANVDPVALGGGVNLSAGDEGRPADRGVVRSPDAASGRAA